MTAEEHIAQALEAEIRARLDARREYRRHRHPEDRSMARENTLMLRYLFSIRRDGIDAHRVEQRRIDAAMRAHREAVEAAEWAEAARTGQYPDVPVAVVVDLGDVFIYPAGVGR